MFPRKPLSFRQQCAQPFGMGKAGFAPTRALSQDVVMACEAGLPALAHLDCYPFPSPWPDPSRVRPFFSAARQADADAVSDGIFQCSFAADKLDSAAIITSDRGSQTCVDPSSSLPFSLCRLPAACRTRHRAGLQVRRPVRLSPMRPAAAPSMVRSSAVWPVLPPVASTWACRPATTNNLTAASAASPVRQGPTGQIARLALLHFAIRPRPGHH